MHFARLLLAVTALSLVGCASTRSLQQTVAGWFGAEPKPRACYAGVARAKLRREPEASSEIVGELALHEGVLAYQSDDGFVFVRAEKGGRSGWVRSSELIGQLPAERKVTSEPQKAATPPEAEAPPPTSEPEPEPQQPEKSVFDPY
jgi:hypothetical protein